MDIKRLITMETLELIREHLNSSEPFDEEMEVETSLDKKMLFKDALSVLGFSYTGGLASCARRQVECSSRSFRRMFLGRTPRGSNTKRNA